MPKPPLPVQSLRDVELLLRSHHPVLFLDAREVARAQVLIEHVADHLQLPYFHWTPSTGLRRAGERTSVYGSEQLDACLDHIRGASLEAVYHLEDALPLLDDVVRVSRLKHAAQHLSRHKGAIVLTGPGEDLPPALQPLTAQVTLAAPSEEEYHAFVRALLHDLRGRMTVRMELTGEDVARLLAQLKGLSFFEVRKVLTRAMVDHGALSPASLDAVLEAKREIVRRSGVLEYFPSELGLEDIAGLSRLKGWLSARASAFRDPERAASFGLTPPRGLLLLGVQGCGKSLCAKAVARAWSLPLVRLDPASLYNKYLGESEKNLRSAIATAERLAPVVLWIDEIEKAFASTESDSSGAPQRLFGTFLTWLQEKPPGVFVIATSNDVSKLPPELLRKGRFDEIFFVDLPNLNTRARILALHLERRGRDPGHFDLQALAQRCEGFSGAELEQAVVSALYTAFTDGSPLSQAHLESELASTRPLSVTMAEPIATLRAWAQDRTVAAD